MCIPLVNLYALYAFQENMNKVLEAQTVAAGAICRGRRDPAARPEQPAAPEQPPQPQ